MTLLAEWTQSSRKCYDVLWRLCGSLVVTDPSVAGGLLQATPSPPPMDNDFLSSIWPDLCPDGGLEGDFAPQTALWTDALVGDMMTET